VSEPKRYQPVVQCVEPSYQAQMIEPKVMEFSEGEYVLHSDYARLKAEVERLEKEVWRMKVFKGIDEDTTATLKDALNTVPEWAKVLETEAENARLKAEVERLRKLGTEMGKHLPDTDEANRAYIDFEAGGQS